MTKLSHEESSPVVRPLIRRQPRTPEAFRLRSKRQIDKIRDAVYREVGITDSNAPDFGIPKLEPILDELGDKQLMELFVKLTRWTDYFQNQFAIEEIAERHAEAEVRRLEGLYLLRNRAERIGPRGGIHPEPSTWLRAQMESDVEIQNAREALRVIYARRKLKQMLFENAERDAAVTSRELTRRTDTGTINRRADRRSP